MARITEEVPANHANWDEWNNSRDRYGGKGETPRNRKPRIARIALMDGRLLTPALSSVEEEREKS